MKAPPSISSVSHTKWSQHELYYTEPPPLLTNAFKHLCIRKCKFILIKGRYSTLCICSVISYAMFDTADYYQVYIRQTREYTCMLLNFWEDGYSQFTGFLYCWGSKGLWQYFFFFPFGNLNNVDDLITKDFNMCMYILKNHPVGATKSSLVRSKILYLWI